MSDEFWADFWSKADEYFTLAREWAARVFLDTMEGTRVFLVNASNVIFRDPQSIAIALAICVGVIVTGVIAGKIAFRVMDRRTNKKYPPEEEAEDKSALSLLE